MSYLSINSHSQRGWLSRRSLPGLLAAGVLSGVSHAQQEFTHTIPGSVPLRESTFSLWVPAEVASEGVRGVLAVSDWESGAEIYDDPRFRDWAVAQRFVVLRFNMRNRDATLFLAKDQSAVDRLFTEALPHFAAAASLPALDDVGVIFTGLSQAGWQSIALADLAPHRTIATLPIHDSTGDRAPGQAQVTTGLGVPALHQVGERDNVNMGTLANGNTYPQTIAGFVTARRAAGALVAMVVQPGTGHTAWEGNEPHSVALMLDWMSAVVASRVPADPTAPLVELTDADGWAGQLDLTFNAVTPWVTVAGASIQSFASVPTGESPQRLWLPSYGFATQWLNYAQTGEHAAPSPDCFASLAAPSDAADVFDLLEFLGRFDRTDASADLVPPAGLTSLDIIEAVARLSVGCE